MTKIEEQLRRAIRESGLSVWRIFRDTGVHTSPLYGFMAGRKSLRFDLAAKVAEYLGLELRQAEKTTAKKGK